MQKSNFFTMPAVAILASAVVCTTAPMLASAQHPGPPPPTLAQDMGDQEAAYLEGLATALKAEKRDNTWAGQKESQLRISYATGKNLPPGALKSVECRRSKCELKLQEYTEEVALSSGRARECPQQLDRESRLWLHPDNPAGFATSSRNNPHLP